MGGAGRTPSPVTRGLDARHFFSADARTFLKGYEHMPVERGSAFLLKVGDGAATPVYTTIAGLRTTQMSINGDPVVITHKGSGAWRELLSGAGVRSVSVSGAGVFTGSLAETRIKNSAFSGQLDDYELSFEGGERLRGKFLVARLDYAGDFNGERSYTLALESSGMVTSL